MEYQHRDTITIKNQQRSDVLMLKNYQKEQFKNRLTNKYLKELSENYYNRKTKCPLHPNAGVVVLLIDDTLKSCDWKIEKLIITN